MVLITHSGPDTLPIGSPAPDFALPGVDGRTYSLLTFAGSHEHIADGRLLTPDQIVDTVLLGSGAVSAADRTAVAAELVRLQQAIDAAPDDVVVDLSWALRGPGSPA